jgi:hypothetical protein
MKKCAILFLVLAVAISFSSSSAFAQATMAQLNGLVKDQTGSVIVKATVTLHSNDTNQNYTTTSNQSGYYILSNIPPGNYELTVTLDINMQVAGANETVEVKTEAPAIEPTRTEVSNVIETQQIQSLPINGRLFTDFALLSPGVTTGRISLQSTFTDPSVTRISFGGQRDLSNSVTVDGADTINTVTGSQRATPSQEAVSEFRVVNCDQVRNQ